VGFEFARSKTNGFIKTRVKDSRKPSALVFRTDGWMCGWVGEGWARERARGGVQVLSLRGWARERARGAYRF
jgi:hypothetical protein